MHHYRHTPFVIAVAGCGLLFVGALLGYAVAEITHPTTSTAAAPDTAPIPTQPTADPYASLTAQQVVETFMTAFQKSDYATCVALFSPITRASFASPDTFALLGQHAIAQAGPITRWEITHFYDRGTDATAAITIYRANAPTQPIGAIAQIVRVNRTWKIETYA